MSSVLVLNNVIKYETISQAKKKFKLRYKRRNTNIKLCNKLYPR